MHPDAPHPGRPPPARRSRSLPPPGRRADGARPRRRAGRRGTACGTRRPAPGNPNPGRPDPVIAGSARSSDQLCSAVLAKPSPGSSTMATRPPRPPRAAPTRPQQFAPHIGDDVVVGRQGVHVGAVATPVHQDPRHAGVGDDGRHLRVGQTARHVVHDPRPGASAASAATVALVVSTLQTMPARASSAITGTTRSRLDLGAGTRWAPGLVDSPPTSMMSAPFAASSRGPARRPPRSRDTGRRRRTNPR